jgi:hypothetical protein
MFALVGTALVEACAPVGPLEFDDAGTLITVEQPAAGAPNAGDAASADAPTSLQVGFDAGEAAVPNPPHFILGLAGNFAYPIGPAGGGLGGTYPNPTVTASGITLGGDVTGPASANTVGKINGATVPASGSLVTGNTLGVTGTAALGYSALNLAGGSGYVTGQLPIGNVAPGTNAQLPITNSGGTAVAWVSASGDWTITAAGVDTVAKVNGTAYPAGGALTTGNGPYASGVSAVTYSALNLAGGAGWVTGVLPAANQAAQTMGGDVTGTTAASTVAKVNGSTIPAGGSLTTGNGPYVSGSAALTYSALNLAGGAGWVTGVLPAGNQAAQTMGGDVTGTTAASTVAKVNGATVPAAGALTTGNGPYVSGTSALTYSALNLAGGSGWVTGTLPAGNQAAQTMGGDVTGTTAASVVSAISGSTPIAITPNSLQWVTGATGPLLTQASESSATKGADFSITPQQSTQATNFGGGNVVINTQAPGGTGVEGGLIIKRGGTQFIQLGTRNANTGTLWLDVTTPSNSNFVLDQAVNTVTINAPINLVASISGTEGWNMSNTRLQIHEAVSGDENQAFNWAATSGALSTAANITLSNAQLQTPVIQLNGATAVGQTTTVANIVGSMWFFDFTGVTLGGNTVTVTTGSGTSSTITATMLVGGKELVTCIVVASNFVSCG